MGVFSQLVNQHDFTEFFDSKKNPSIPGNCFSLNLLTPTMNVARSFLSLQECFIANGRFDYSRGTESPVYFPIDSRCYARDFIDPS